MVGVIIRIRIYCVMFLGRGWVCVCLYIKFVWSFICTGNIHSVIETFIGSDILRGRSMVSSSLLLGEGMYFIHVGVSV